MCPLLCNYTLHSILHLVCSYSLSNFRMQYVYIVIVLVINLEVYDYKIIIMPKRFEEFAVCHI